ncbi:MAG: hypothetical protein ACXW0J_07315 [Nitrososphaeraceae archaeon]
MKKTAIVLLLFCLASCFVLNSCKKKDDAIPANENANTTGSTTSVGVYGNLQSGYNLLDYGSGVTMLDSNVLANFYSSAANNTAPTSIYAGTVSVNSNGLKFNNSSNYYIDTTHTINIHQLNWSAIGTGTVSSFIYSYSPLYPKYSGTLLLQDTCVKSNGINISLTGITNANSGVIIRVYQGPNMVTKTINAPSGTVNFSSSDLAGLTVNAPLTISVYLLDMNIVSVGSINYTAACFYQYIKFSYLK